MKPFNIDVVQIEIFMLIFFRIFALLYVTPIMGDKRVPIMLRIGFSVILSFVVFPVTNGYNVVLSDVMNFLFAAGREIIIGMSLGFIVKLLFSAIDFAAEISGFQMGFGMVSVLDPNFDDQVSIITQFESIVAILIFLSINAHHFIIESICRSFKVVPLGRMILSGRITDYFITMSTEIFIISLKISAPIIVTLLLTNIILGILVRTVPQINMFMISFPVTIGLGLIVLGFSLPFMAEVFKNIFFTIDFRMLKLLKLFI